MTNPPQKSNQLANSTRIANSTRFAKPKTTILIQLITSPKHVRSLSKRSQVFYQKLAFCQNQFVRYLGSGIVEIPSDQVFSRQRCHPNRHFCLRLHGLQPNRHPSILSNVSDSQFVQTDSFVCMFSSVVFIFLICIAHNLAKLFLCHTPP